MFKTGPVFWFILDLTLSFSQLENNLSVSSMQTISRNPAPEVLVKQANLYYLLWRNFTFDVLALVTVYRVIKRPLLVISNYSPTAPSQHSSTHFFPFHFFCLLFGSMLSFPFSPYSCMHKILREEVLWNRIFIHFLNLRLCFKQKRTHVKLY